VRGMRVGMMICFDWAFPEAARTLMLQGADVICHPSNLVLTYCQGAMVVRCIENLLFAVTANRYGTERRPHGELSFTGQSQIVAPRGELLHRSPPDRDDLHLVEVDVTLARDKGIGVRGQHMGARNDVVRDRRPDFYRELCRHGGDA
jgi:predicted amidohydrolase